jgi:KDO2-lipid IV(A) lauroyltransferase
MTKSILVRVGTWMLTFMPDGVAAAIAIAAAELCWWCLRSRRRIVHENLRYIASDRTETERRQLGRATFRNLALCTLDFLRLPLLTPDQIDRLIEVRGIEHLDRALAQGVGVILVGGHLGNWEIGGAYLGVHEYPIHALAEDQAVGVDTYETYARYRTRAGLKLLRLSRGVFAGRRALKQGAVLALLGDRSINSRGHIVNFCGGRRELPIGPAVLARWSGATVLLWSLLLNPTGPRRYLAVVEPPLAPQKDRADDRGFTEAIGERLSQVVKEHPDQWFVFQPHWL